MLPPLVPASPPPRPAPPRSRACSTLEPIPPPAHEPEPPLRFPRRPFAPRPRLPSPPTSPAAVRLDYYRSSLRAVRARPPSIEPDAAAEAEHRFAAVHTAVRAELSLRRVRRTEDGWRVELSAAVRALLGEGELGREHAEVERVVERLVGGAWLAGKDGIVTPEQFLRALSHGAGGLSTFARAFDDVHRVARLVLELHQAEAGLRDGEPLDATGRSLLASIAHNFALVDALGSAASAGKAVVGTQRTTRIVTHTGETVTATPEQEVLVRSARRPGLTRATAHAGTGKTTAMLGFAQVAAEDEDVALMLVKSKRLQGELRETFLHEPRVNALTLNAVVFRALVEQFGGRFRRKFADERGFPKSLSHSLVRNLLDIPHKGYRYADNTEGRVKSLAGKRIAERIIKGFSSFTASIDAAPSVSHLPHQGGPIIPEGELLDWVRQLWARVSDLDDKQAPLGFDAQVKMCQLDKAWRMPELGPLLVDEAQDLTPAELDLCVREQERRRVLLIGDPLQAIDGFRGTNDLWLSLPVDTQLSLVGSQRFGHDVATIANELLASNGYEGEPLYGSPRKNTVVYRESEVVGERSGRVVLCPTYRTMYAEALKLVQSADPPRTIRLLKSRNSPAEQYFRLVRHAWHLQHNVPLPPPPDSSCWHPALGRYNTMAAFMDEILSWGSDLPHGPDFPFGAWETVLVMIKEGDLLRKNLLDELAQLERLVVPEGAEAEVTLSISHQVKGLDFADVVVSPSFGTARHMRDWHRLVHVALTRPTRSLEIPNTLVNLEAHHRGLHNFQLLPLRGSALAHTCPSCFTPSALPLIGYSTPLPFHPSHAPAPPAEASTTDAALSAALESTSPSASIARKRRHAPLRALAAFARDPAGAAGAALADGPDAASAEEAGRVFDGAIGAQEERMKDVENAYAEVARGTI
ncbi:F-box DNA helicase 1 [Rhodotorula kratochvilovae]